MRQSPIHLAFGFLLAIAGLCATGCTAIGYSIGSSVDADNAIAPGTPITHLSKMEEGEGYRLIKIDSSVVIGEYVVVQGKDLKEVLAHNLDVDLIADSMMQPVDLRIGMDVGSQVVFVPIDSIAHVEAGDFITPSSARIVGASVGLLIDVAVCAVAVAYLDSEFRRSWSWGMGAR